MKNLRTALYVLLPLLLIAAASPIVHTIYTTGTLAQVDARTIANVTNTPNITWTQSGNSGSAFFSVSPGVWGASSEAFGVGATALGPLSTALGESAAANGTNSLALGYSAQVFLAGYSGIAIGQNATVNAPNGIALGAGVTAGANQIVLGNGQSIIGNGGGLTNLQTTIYTNIAQMLASPLTNSCYVVSYYGIPDEAKRQWGGGNFIYLTNQTVLATNFGTLFTNSMSGGYWQRVVPNPSVNDLAWFGVNSCLTPVTESFLPFDCTLQINSCVTSTPAYGYISVPPMAIQTAWVNLTNRDHLTIEGSGKTHGSASWLNSSLIYNQPTPTNVWITEYNAGHVTLKGLTYYGIVPLSSSTNVPAVLIDIDRLPGSGSLPAGANTPTDDSIIDCCFNAFCTNTPQFRAIRLGHQATANIEFIRVSGCQFACGNDQTTNQFGDLTNNGVAIEIGNNSNGFNDQFDHLEFAACNIDIICAQGSFTLDNWLDERPVCSFSFTNWTGPISIKNGRSEMANAGQALAMAAGYGSVSLEHNTWSGTGNGGIPLIQMFASSAGGQPQLSLLNNTFDTTAGNTFLNCTNTYSYAQIESKNNNFPHLAATNTGYITVANLQAPGQGLVAEDDIFVGGLPYSYHTTTFHGLNSWTAGGVPFTWLNQAYKSNSITIATANGNGTNGATIDTNDDVIISGSFIGDGSRLTGLGSSSATNAATWFATNTTALVETLTTMDFVRAAATTAETDIRINAAGVGLASPLRLGSGQGSAINPLVDWTLVANGIAPEIDNSSVWTNFFALNLTAGTGGSFTGNGAGLTNCSVAFFTNFNNGMLQSNLTSYTMFWKVPVVVSQPATTLGSAEVDAEIWSPGGTTNVIDSISISGGATSVLSTNRGTLVFEVPPGWGFAVTNKVSGASYVAALDGTKTNFLSLRP